MSDLRRRDLRAACTTARLGPLSLNPADGERGMDARQAEQVLAECWRAALAAVDPVKVTPPVLPPPPKGRTLVIAAGKAAAAMAAAVEDHWRGPLSGIAVTRYGHAAPCRRIEVIEAAHPVPDAAGEAAARRALALASQLGPDDLALILLSGGGSALLAAAAPGVSLADVRAVTAQLLRSGATIQEINTVRKHLSAISGGRLAAAAHPAQVVAIAISDVVGDDPAVIASGPATPDPTSFADARAVLRRRKVTPPPSVAQRLANEEDETPKPGDPRLAQVRFCYAARPIDALCAAAEAASRAGVTPLVLGDAVEGEAREVGRALAGIAASVQRHGLPTPRPAIILSGGETTVTVTGHGRGGRNAEWLLSAALSLGDQPGLYGWACDTDGVDGMEDNAGAWFAPGDLARARSMGLDPAALLADNDAYTYFAALDRLVVTGPTLTNVNDFRALLAT